MNSIKDVVLPATDIYLSSRPTTNPESEFIVISTPTPVVDKTAYGTCLVSLDIYTKDNASGIKDITKESEIFDKVMDLLPILGSAYSFDLSKLPVKDLGSDGMYFHVLRISLECMIKTHLTI